MSSSSLWDKQIHTVHKVLLTSENRHRTMLARDWRIRHFGVNLNGVNEVIERERAWRETIERRGASGKFRVELNITYTDMHDECPVRATVS